ncbi:acetate uptake transporter family protein [Syntrophothermus lipocalidus]|uniref:GPR1/FUN34/yaaH family protein n=1 Tax=Syntrophothermus lipocalidus (strain DSM 12680 / TGB-C1) TaxID=643648 RepID=D7CKY1_SYNLT|nr:GPR1/FUN34/YaaH family transporter [Syntrophothermus lipocalidus]ADI01366.1 conserved hypothetical protein [Syntrophothermus lipocalidus DSM 12680]
MSGNNSGAGFANPTPAGLVALSMACFAFFALLTGRVDHSTTPVMAFWLLGGFIVQIVTGVIELREGNLPGGNIFTWFAAFFMFTTGCVFLFEYLGHSLNWHMSGAVEGWAWAALTLSLLFWTPAYLKAPLYLFAAIVFMDVACPMLTLMKLGILAPTVAPIIGWLMLIAGLLGLWLGACIVVNGVFGREVYPCPGPILKD